jgi:hypothetical protein
VLAGGREVNGKGVARSCFQMVQDTSAYGAAGRGEGDASPALERQEHAGHVGVMVTNTRLQCWIFKRLYKIGADVSLLWMYDRCN